jgi:hypothetical protein
LANADFPNQKQKATRGEIFYVEVPESWRRFGWGTSLVLDALRKMREEGAETVNMDATTPEGQALIDSLLEKGYIEGPIQESETGKAEYKIADLGGEDIVSFESNWANTKFGEQLDKVVNSFEHVVGAMPSRLHMVTDDIDTALDKVYELEKQSARRSGDKDPDPAVVEAERGRLKKWLSRVAGGAVPANWYKDLVGYVDEEWTTGEVTVNTSQGERTFKSEEGEPEFVMAHELGHALQHDIKDSSLWLVTHDWSGDGIPHSYRQTMLPLYKDMKAVEKEFYADMIGWAVRLHFNPDEDRISIGGDRAFRVRDLLEGDAHELVEKIMDNIKEQLAPKDEGAEVSKSEKDKEELVTVIMPLYHRGGGTVYEMVVMLKGEVPEVGELLIDEEEPVERVTSGPLRRVVIKGGAGSGHFDHKGRPGKVGGSLPKGGGGGSENGADGAEGEREDGLHKLLEEGDPFDTGGPLLGGEEEGEEKEEFDPTDTEWLGEVVDEEAMENALEILEGDEGEDESPLAELLKYDPRTNPPDDFPEDGVFFEWDQEDEAHQWALENFPGKEDYTPEEIEKLERYKLLRTSRRLNAVLREQKGDMIFPQDPSLERTKDLIDSAMDKSRLQQDTVLYRGFRLYEGEEAEYHGELTEGEFEQEEPYRSSFDLDFGTVFTDRGFVSATLTLNQAEKFSRVQHGEGRQIIFRITAPAGTPAVYMEHFAKHDDPDIGVDFENEEEILLDRGLKYKVVAQRHLMAMQQWSDMPDIMELWDLEIIGRQED